MDLVAMDFHTVQVSFQFPMAVHSITLPQPGPVYPDISACTEHGFCRAPLLDHPLPFEEYPWKQPWQSFIL